MPNGISLEAGTQTEELFSNRSFLLRLEFNVDIRDKMGNKWDSFPKLSL
jgi:hypothetical protein